MNKYIFIGSSSFPGSSSGISQSVYAQIKALHNAGYSVVCFTPTTGKISIEKIVKSLSILHYHGVESDSLEELKLMVELYNKYCPEMIINNDNPYLSNLMQFAECAKLSICHMNKTTINSLAVYDGASAHRVGAISHYMLSDLRRKLDVKEKVAFVPNIFIPPVDEQSADLVLDEGLVSGDKLRILYSGGSNSNKGISYVRDLLKSVENSPMSKSIQVDLFGRYNQADIAFLKSFENVDISIHGLTSSDILYRYLQKTDYLLFPSLNEGLPMTILEALSAKTAILSIDGVGGVCDLVLNGFNGICVDKNNWVDMSMSYINLALRAPEKLMRLKINSYSIFVEGFSQFQFVCEIKEMIESCVKKKNYIDLFERNANKDIRLDLISWHRVPKGHIRYYKLLGVKQRFGRLPKKAYVI
ncbi:glycosyltransferase family 4 protein [Pseudidiomarina andamanensis]|uniref:Glycosyltransferase n=1 Tax=Pseudidiomarina andamanensis TaxID=1940690 RepID=A0AA92EWQ4_9GAMM|nr:glycosyltransferase family 4 protein [Pseudidiomarina andamanensis]MDS0217758.1 glycosyltransferase family 4 protein [Pseudidiomarina andamanensis]QGT96745.1 glycosyltransferase [Pseudidiomarina andamanensis]